MSEYTSYGKEDNKNNLPDIINICNQIGNAYKSLGGYQQAINYFQQSLEIATEIGDRNKISNSLSGLGIAYDSLGNYERAINYFQQSLEIKKEIGDHNGISISLGNLGNAYGYLGNYEEAINYYQQSLEIATEIENRNGIGDSLEIKTEIGDRNGEANTWFNLGITRQNLQQKLEAKAAYENARNLFQAIGLDKKVRDCNEAIQSLEEE